MYKVKYSNSFKKDLKSYRGNKVVFDRLLVVAYLLKNNLSLPISMRLHKLKGDMSQFYEFHLKPDVLVIYKKNDDTKIISLMRIGSHSKLF